MDKAAVKTALGAYRAGHRDAGDPAFAEALREAARNPELAAWLAEQQRFDALMAAALQQAPPPAGLKESILRAAGSDGKPFPGAAATPFARPRPVAWLAMAAALALAFALGRLTLPRAAGPAAAGRAGANRLALQAIAYTGKMPALQFVCFDAAEVAHWVQEKATAMRMGQFLDKPVASMRMIGSSAAQWEGKPVIMIALQNGQQMAMLYVVRAADFPDAVHGAGEIMEKDGWISKTGRHGDHLYVLATKGTRQNLDFPLPL